MAWGTITLIGSGELSPLLGKTYRKLLAPLAGDVRGAVLDTPAGFELNVEQLTAKILAYFQQRLGLTLRVAALRGPDVSAETVENCLRVLAGANFIFGDGGSPSYAVRVWQATPVGAAIGARLQAGAHLALASASALAAGRFVIPVYEIFKAGQDPVWLPGLDWLGPLGLQLAVVPHWNNQEGGHYDTRGCYIGLARLARLEAQLPVDAVMLGIDEYTACTIRPATEDVEVSGSGGVTVRHRGHETFFGSGTAFALDYLRGAEARLVYRPPGVQVVPIERRDPPAPATSLLPDSKALDRELTRLVDTLVRLRGRLRAEKQWALADEVRAELTALGVKVFDEGEGTRWVWEG